MLIAPSWMLLKRACRGKSAQLRTSLLLAAGGCAPAVPVDLLLVNGNVYPEPGQPNRAQVIAVQADTIAFVGPASEGDRFRALARQVIDLKGATVFPGFADGHSHLEEIGARQLGFNVEGTNTKTAFLGRIRERIGQTKNGDWLVGGGWVETFWTPPVFPTRWDLDSVAPNNPVVLFRFDYHAAVLNSRALQALGIDGRTRAPSGGRFNRAANGELDGMVLDAALELVIRKLPQPTEAEMEQRQVVGASHSVAQGWTQIHDAGGSWADVLRLDRLYREGKIKLRDYRAVSGPGPAAESLLTKGAALRAHGGRFTVRTIKLVADGAMGSRGAWLLAPYADDPSNSGLLTVDTIVASALLARALGKGIQVETHAIGDRANRLVLDLYQRALVGPNASDARWRVEHASMIAPEDLPRFKALGVLPSVQPSFLLEDLYFAPRRFGAARMDRVYPFRSLVATGIPVIGGSDVPASTGEPLVGFYAAVARRDLDGRSGPDSLWRPEERVTRQQALQMFTTWPAFGAFEEDKRGRIAPGKWADLTIVDRDIMTVPDPEILRARVIMTIIAGEIVHRADSAK